MLTKTKTTFLLIGTFVLGMVLGMVLSNTYIHYRHEKMRRSMRSPDWFMNRFEQIVQPTAEQKAAIQEVFRKHHEKMMRYQKEFPMHMDTLRQELDAILTDEQKQKLKDAPWMFKDRPDRHRDPRHGPPNMDDDRGFMPPPPPPED